MASDTAGKQKRSHPLSCVVVRPPRPYEKHRIIKRCELYCKNQKILKFPSFWNSKISSQQREAVRSNVNPSGHRDPEYVLRQVQKEVFAGLLRKLGWIVTRKSSSMLGSWKLFFRFRFGRIFWDGCSVVVLFVSSKSVLDVVAVF